MIDWDERCPELGRPGTRCYFKAGHFKACEFGVDDPATWRTNADGSLVCPHRDLGVCEDCARIPGVVEVVGAHFHDPFGKIAEGLR